MFPEHFYAYIIISEVLSESARSAFSRKTDVFQTRRAKTYVFAKTRQGFKSFYRKIKTLLLIVYNNTFWIVLQYNIE